MGEKKDMAKLLQEATTTEYVDKIAIMRGKLARSNTDLKQAILRLTRELEIERERSQLLLEVKEAPPIVYAIPQPPRRKDKPLTASFALLSDAHVEEVVEARKVNGLNEHNLAIAEEKLDMYWRNVVKLVKKESMEADIRVHTQWLGGDLFTGHIHPELVEVTELSPTEAVVWLRQRVAAGLRYLRANLDVEEILVPCNWGNHGRCHDSETELLTAEGWKRWNEVQVGDVVATFNQSTHAAEWQPLQDLYVDMYDGPMIHVQHRSADFLVTPRHRMLVADSHSDRTRMVEMQDLTAETIGAGYFPKMALGHDRDWNGVSDDELRLVGWVLTDGSYVQQYGATDIDLYQSKPKGIAAIRGLLADLGYQHTEYTRTRSLPKIQGVQVKSALPAVRFRISRASARRLLDLLPDKKLLPDWCHNLSQRQAHVLLDALMAGDGAAGRGRFGGELHGTRAFLDAVQGFLLVNGVSSRVRTTSRNDAVLCIRGSRRGYINDWDKSVRTEAYKGVIWCGTVENGTLMTRRNGIPLISGNTTMYPRIATAMEHSFEWMLYQIMQEDFAGESGIRFEVASGYHLYVDYMGYKVRFHHGDMIEYRGGVGGLHVPLNKKIAKWNGAMPAHLDVIGHWHQKLDLEYAIVNSSLIGFSPYSLKIAASPEPPQQVFFLADLERKQKTGVYPVHVLEGGTWEQHRRQRSAGRTAAASSGSSRRSKPTGRLRTRSS